jgi:hypothetical protein
LLTQAQQARKKVEEETQKTLHNLELKHQQAEAKIVEGES